MKSTVSDISVGRNQEDNVRGKRKYSRPTLVVYGSVREFTKGMNGTNFDNGQNNNTRKGDSDPILKENVIRVGDHPLGFGLYIFEYKPEFRLALGHGRHFGVMADEVERIVPEAVSVHPNGYRQVDYALLGVFPARH